MNGIRVGKFGAVMLLVLLAVVVSGCAWRGACPVEEQAEQPKVVKAEPVIQQVDTGKLEARLADLEKRLAADESAIAEAKKIADKALKCCNKEYVTIYSEVVYFGSNSSVLDKESTDKLDRVAEKLKMDPDYIIEIAGHCDSVGNIDYNILLGQRRAEAVRTYLVDKQHINYPRVTIRSSGKAEPAAENDTEEGRGKNRRATVSVLGYVKE